MTQKQIKIPLRGYYYFAQKLYGEADATRKPDEEKPYSTQNILEDAPLPHWPDWANGSPYYNFELNKFTQRRVLMANIAWSLVNTANKCISKGIQDVILFGKTLSKEELMAPIRESCAILYNSMHPSGKIGEIEYHNLKEQLEQCRMINDDAKIIRDHFHLDNEPIFKKLLTEDFEHSFLKAIKIENNSTVSFAYNALNIALYGLEDKSLAKKVSHARLESILQYIHNNPDIMGHERKIIWTITQEKELGLLTDKEIKEKILLYLKLISPTATKYEIQSIEKTLEFIKN